MKREKKRGRKSKDESGRSGAAKGFAAVWDDYWFGPVAAVRPYLLMKAALLLLAFDVWLLRIPQSWRPGVDGFNVAHFEWLGRLSPPVTPGLDAGLHLANGILALVCVLTGAGVALRALLALLYTYSWAMSMLDNFQHHYFLSLMLIAFVFFPRPRAVDLFPAGGDRGDRTDASAANIPVGRATVGAWAYVLLGVNVAIVYFFTAVNKLEPAWRRGIFIERLARRNHWLGPIESWFTQAAGSKEIFWQSAAVTIVAVELWIAAGYLLAVSRDRSPSGRRAVVCLATLLAVVGLNGVGNELVLSLVIGWFSYYMILFAGIYCLPAAPLWKICEALSWPARRLAAIAENRTAGAGPSAKSSRGLAVAGSAAATVWVYFSVAALDLPGASTVGFLAALALSALLVFALVRREYRIPVRYSLAAGLAALVLWTTLSQSAARFYFYYLTAAHLRARDRPDDAREASQKAFRYLPARRQDLLKLTKQKSSEAP